MGEGKGEELKYVKSRIALAFPKLVGPKLDKLLDTDETA
jgi:hypothetical protein